MDCSFTRNVVIFFVKDIQGGTLLIIKLTIIGALLYLLLFEGGRSRYLIQYLPFFYLLSANGLARINDIVSINGIKNHLHQRTIEALCQ